MSTARHSGSSTALPASRRVDTGMVREANSQLVVGLLRRHGPMSRADIVRRSGLTRPTVLAIVNALLASDTVKETGTEPRRSTPGRPGSLLAFNAGALVTAACRIRSATVEVVVADADGEILHEATAPLERRTPGWTLEQVAAAVMAAVTEHGDPERLAAVGVLVPGSVDPDSGVCRYSAPLGWRDVPVADELTTRLEVPVVTLNPAHAAALGEMTHGEHGTRDLVAVLLDSGIGAGIVSGGRLITGSGGMAGEIGHMRVVESDVRCVCGRTGCVETVASGRHIIEQATRILGSDAPANPRLADLEGLHPDLDHVLSNAAHWLGVAASWLVNALGPDVVVLGGTPFTAGSRHFFTAFRHTTLGHSLMGEDKLRIVLSELEGRSDFRGALRAAQEQLPTTFAPLHSIVPLVRTVAA